MYVSLNKLWFHNHNYFSRNSSPNYEANSKGDGENCGCVIAESESQSFDFKGNFKGKLCTCGRRQQDVVTFNYELLCFIDWSHCTHVGSLLRERWQLSRLWLRQRFIRRFSLNPSDLDFMKRKLFWKLWICVEARQKRPEANSMPGSPSNASVDYFPLFLFPLFLSQFL